VGASNSLVAHGLIAQSIPSRGEAVMGKPTVILIGANKGGVGKTTVARTLLDYLRKQEVPTRAFDTEAPKGTLQRFHPDVSEIVDVTAVADQMRIFDTVSDSAVTVIDVRAGLLSSTFCAPYATSAFSTRPKTGSSHSSCFIFSALPLPP
jgi:hypothetical protein